jgi:thiamine biosynthesis protein ThiC
MSKVKIVIKNRRNGKEIVCGGSELIVVFPYGLSSAASNVKEELEKVKLAEKLGGSIVVDKNKLRSCRKVEVKV